MSRCSSHLCRVARSRAERRCDIVMSDQPETKGMIELVRRKYKLLQRDQKWGMAGVHDKEEISEINKRLKKFLYA